MAATIASGFWILFSVLDELLFFSPFFAFWIPSDAIINFIISNIMAVMIGILVSINVYYLLECQNSHFSQQGESSNRSRNNNIQNLKNKKNGSISKYIIHTSSLLAILSGTCISCSSSLGLWVIASVASVAGLGAATAFSSFLSEYQIPIRLIILAVLGWGFVSINKEINMSPQCRIARK